MGIKSTNRRESYYNYFGDSGTDAMKPYDPDLPLSWCGNRGLWAGGYSATNIIDYITITSPGNATDFGDLTVARNALAGCAAANDRGFYSGGHDASAPTDIIDYITITTTGNATDFGDLTIDIYYCAAVASYSRALVGGGYPDNNTIGYFETSTPGNAIDFGDLTVARQGPGACSNGVGYDADRACWGGGGSTYDTIDYVAISTPGNATDFGDLTQARRYTSACSGD